MTLHRSILKTLTSGSLSLADLQMATAVSLPTLRKAVQELTAARWIRVVGQAEANGGRPAMLFGLDSTHYLVVAVHLQLPGVHLATCDLYGNVLDTRDLFDKVIPSPTEVVQAITGYVEWARSAFNNRAILGVGLATPGFIDATTGDILVIGRVKGWQKIPICRRLQDLLQVPVYVANDIDCMAFAEFHYTHDLDERNLAYVGFDEGVKISLFLRGQLYKSFLGNAGLISSALLRVDGVANSEDVVDLLSLVGVSHLLERRIHLLPESERAAYTDLLSLSARRRMLSIVQGSDLGICRQIAHEVIQATATVVANMALLIQPDVVVMGGALSRMSNPLFEDLRRAISARLPGLVDHHVLIQQASFSSPSTAAIGAAHHLWDCYLSQADQDTLQIAYNRD